MRTLKLTIAYDGTRYAGWQIQQRGTRHIALSRQHPPQSVADPPRSMAGSAHSTKHTADSRRKPTVQGTLERILRQILQEPVRVVGSGRTDAGVHALAQVAHVKTRAAVSCERLRRSLNQLLPADLAVLAAEDAPPSFHARFDAIRKRYRYRMFTGPVVPPFIRPYVHHVSAPLRLDWMRREAAALRGRHNFRAFARAPHLERNYTRTITSVALRRAGHELHLELEGNGFLHTMVRSIAGTLLDVGRGRLALGTVKRMLRTSDRRLAGTTAPPNGLTLVRVAYGRRHA